MHNRATHNNMTRLMFPWMSPSVINKVHHEIDNPSATMKAAQSIKNSTMGSQAYSIPGMYMGGHRQYNHDLFSMLMAGYMAGGPQGIQVAMGHAAQDLMRTQMNKVFGQTGGDLAEAAFNHLMHNSFRRR